MELLNISILICIGFANLIYAKLESCSLPVLRPQLCLVYDTYMNPFQLAEELPIEIGSSIDLYDVTDVNTRQHSITLHFDLTFIWNDTAITLAKPENQ